VPNCISLFLEFFKTFYRNNIGCSLSGRQHGVNKGCVEDVSEILIFSVLKLNDYMTIPDILLVKINVFA